MLKAKMFIVLLFGWLLASCTSSPPSTLSSKLSPPLDQLYHLACEVDSMDQAESEASRLYSAYHMPFRVGNGNGPTSWRTNVWIDPINQNIATLTAIDSVIATVATDVRKDGGRCSITIDMCDLRVLQQCWAVRAIWLPGRG